MGWPRAQAPPLTFTASWGRPSSCMAAMVTTAKASLISKRSTSPVCQPTRSHRVRIAPTGAVVNQAGAWAWPAWPRITARGARPRRSASEARMSTSAAPPSEMELEFAGVTVPSRRKAGLRAGMRSMRACPGCSSVSTRSSPPRPVTVTGAISSAKSPSAMARLARLSDSIAKASWASRVKP